MSERLPPPQNEYFFEHPPWNNRWGLFGLALIVSCFDFLAGPVIMFPVFFVAPVSLLAWNCELRTALKMGAVLCVVRFCIQYAWGIPYEFHVAVINGILRAGILLFITFLISKLSQQTKALRARVRTLEGILPTCGFCKDIRDEKGRWHEIEDYVTSRTEAQFSHGICPKCVAQHYGDIPQEKVLGEAP